MPVTTFYFHVFRKRRDEGLSSDEPSTWSSYSSRPSQQTALGRRSAEKKTYRGAASVPNIHRSREDSSSSDHSSARSPSPNPTKVVVQPVRYTSKVTTVINHVPATENDGQDDKAAHREVTPATGPTAKQVNDERKTQPPPSTWRSNLTSTNSKFSNANPSRFGSRTSPSEAPSSSSTNTVVMRRKSPGQSK